MTVEDVQTGSGQCPTETNRRSETAWSTEHVNTPVYAVVSTVADATESAPCDLPPLARVIDPDALNALFASGSTTGDTTVQFQYVGHTVVVTGEGDVDVSPTDE
ncbi:HalOD1 output domain-containing protein [Natronobacterium gregoryi]|uniref:Halobacterial output domain-containing protein n=2 Tax=Natronobacterium gregoryi TaxID=44930 RepID=L0AJN5_NATGS|nr:HalOD1 output domain-containing protein [Natronobacterium gregoryi]AFZ74026.1 hypothetical protein Natgr_2886 [Natronobacterium gregoryi SP2]ELY70598.1 hypothetical protein C490_06474 [Natronobacterium gregoryi SP2]PLK20774.1 hypothetical protein CYV19_07625 [Natronobacterium gregoryi SP2]SFJ07385.1 hypothetical protein SAMN05443661_11356 [Natronobacterium gregoryi]